MGLRTPKQRIPSQSPYFSLFFAFRFRVSWPPISRLPPLVLPFCFFAGAVPSASPVVGASAADAADVAATAVGAATGVASSATTGASVAAAAAAAARAVDDVIVAVAAAAAAARAVGDVIVAAAAAAAAAVAIAACTAGSFILVPAAAQLSFSFISCIATGAVGREYFPRFFSRFPVFSPAFFFS